MSRQRSVRHSASAIAALAWSAELAYQIYLHALSASLPAGIGVSFDGSPLVILWQVAAVVGLCLAVVAYFARQHWEWLLFACAAIFFVAWFTFANWAGGPVNAYVLRWRVAQYFGAYIEAGFYIRDILMPLALSTAVVIAIRNLLRPSVQGADALNA